MREEEVADKSGNIQATIYSGSEVQRRHFYGTCNVRGQKVEEHAATDLDLRNDENRPSLTSGAEAEDRQEVLSKNTIDELADAPTVGNYIGLWSSNIPEEMQKYWLKNETGSL